MINPISDTLIWALYDIVSSTHGGGVEPKAPDVIEKAVFHGNNFCSRDEDIFKIAAFYGSEIIQKKPFYDNNFSTGYLVMELFLYINGYQVLLNDFEVFNTTYKLSTGEIQNDDLESLLQLKSEKIENSH